MALKRLFSSSPELSETSNKNFRNVQIDAIGVGLANAASPFLPVFLTRLGASAFQVGLLSSMPAFTGLLLSLPLGRWLQSQENIVKWFSVARLLVITCYALTGIAAFFLAEDALIITILAIWALATIPQTIVSITFSVVMNAVAGPNYRFELMTRRWSTLGITTTLAVIGIGQMLDRMIFPVNYRLMFILLSFGGLISFYFSSHINIPPAFQQKISERTSIKSQILEMKELISREKNFNSFILKRFIFLTGSAFAAPLIPLYLVRVAHATDGWISAINTAQTAVLVIGYFFWTTQTRKRGSRKVLIWTTLGVSLYPFLMAFTVSDWQLTLLAGLSGIFQAGVDLVFFDELMKAVPLEYSALFVSYAQGIQFLSSIIAPTAATLIATTFSLPVGLITAAAFRFIGFIMFALPAKKKVMPQPN